MSYELQVLANKNKFSVVYSFVLKVSALFYRYPVKNSPILAGVNGLLGV